MGNLLCVGLRAWTCPPNWPAFHLYYRWPDWKRFGRGGHRAVLSLAWRLPFTYRINYLSHGVSVAGMRGPNSQNTARGPFQNSGWHQRGPAAVFKICHVLFFFFFLPNHPHKCRLKLVSCLQHPQAGNCLQNTLTPKGEQTSLSWPMHCEAFGWWVIDGVPGRSWAGGRPWHAPSSPMSALGTG